MDGDEKFLADINSRSISRFGEPLLREFPLSMLAGIAVSGKGFNYSGCNKCFLTHLSFVLDLQHILPVSIY